jgi:hypothetical protein
MKWEIGDYRYCLISTGALEQWLPPGSVVDVPLNSLLEALFEIVAWIPVQFPLRE